MSGIHHERHHDWRRLAADTSATFVWVIGPKFFQPSFFGPPVLKFNIAAGGHSAAFNMDVGGPRCARCQRVVIHIRSDDRVGCYADGAQLYRCTVQGPARLIHYASGRCRRLPGDFALRLYHVTNPKAYAAIRTSGEIWSSPWNLQGTRKLRNVAYVYLTSLPKVSDEEDLRRIAMASDGEIRFQTSSRRAREKVVSLTVYRESTSGRTTALAVEVPAGLIAPSHLRVHDGDDGQAYYEVVAPEIYRIGVVPGTALKLADGVGSIDDARLKRFNNVILGEADEARGLAAPYDEDDTEYLMHHEILGSDGDLFRFWLENANTDQISWRSIDPREFAPVD